MVTDFDENSILIDRQKNTQHTDDAYQKVCPLQESQASQKTHNCTTIFVCVAGGRTIPIRLNEKAFETLTAGDIRREISRLAPKLPTGAKSLILAHRGSPFTDERSLLAEKQVTSHSTINASLSLCGGNDDKFKCPVVDCTDTTKHSNQEELDAHMLKKHPTNNTIQESETWTIEFKHRDAEQKFGYGPDETIFTQEKIQIQNVKWFDLWQNLIKSVNKAKGKKLKQNDWQEFRFEYDNKKDTIVLTVSNDKQSLEDFLAPIKKIKNQDQSQEEIDPVMGPSMIGAAQTDEKLVTIHISLLKGIDQTGAKGFMNEIKFIDQNDRKNIIALLKKQKSKAAETNAPILLSQDSFDLVSILDSYFQTKTDEGKLEDKQIKNLLIVSTKDQIENLILDLRDQDKDQDHDDKDCSELDFDKDKSNLDDILEFLIRKNGQWTNQTQQINKNSSVDAKKQLVSRLISKQMIEFTDKSDVAYQDEQEETKDKPLSGYPTLEILESQRSMTSFNDTNSISFSMTSYQNQQQDGVKVDPDTILIRMIKSIPDILRNHLRKLQPEQYAYLLLITLNDEDLMFDIFKLIKDSNKTSSEQFWRCMPKKYQIMVWKKFLQESDLSLLEREQGGVSYDSEVNEARKNRELSLSQTQQLWDDIETDQWLKVWRLFQDKKTTKPQSVVHAMTDQQKLKLWRVLDLKSKLSLYEQIDDAKKRHLWQLLDHDDRVGLIQVISKTKLDQKNQSVTKLIKQNTVKEDEGIAKQINQKLEKLSYLFNLLGLEDKSILVSMLDKKIADTLIDLNMEKPEEKQMFFHYQQFSQAERTEGTPDSFVNNILEKFYEDHNQYVPFNKIEDGYVQCIPDPNVKNGYITVQLIDQSQRNQSVDERSETGFNDNLRLIENKQGVLQETNLNEARNYEKLGIISYWEVTPSRGFWCTHSFHVPNPLTFNVEKVDKDQTVKRPKEDCVYKNVLFVGRNNEIFFFNSKVDVTKDTKQNRNNDSDDFYLRIMNLDQNKANNEQSRELQENCSTFRITSDTELYEYLEKGNYSFKMYGQDVFFMNSVPTLITHKKMKAPVKIQEEKSFQTESELEEADQSNEVYRFVAFSKCGIYDKGPTTYFYDLQHSKEICKILGAEVFIDYHSGIQGEKRNGDEEVKQKGDDGDKDAQIICLSHKFFMEKAQEEYAKWDSLITEKDKKDSDDSKKQNNKQEYIQKFIYYMKSDKKASEKQEWFSDSQVVCYPIDLAELHNDFDDTKDIEYKCSEIRKDKEYTKNQIDEESWKTFDLTIDKETKEFNRIDMWENRYYRNIPVHIFLDSRERKGENPQAFTMLFQNRFALTLALTQSQNEEKETAQQNEIKREDGEEGKVAENVKKDEDIKQQYKAKYFVPDAQFIIFDNHEQNKQKIFVQTTARDEANHSRENIQKQNRFGVTLYNITDIGCQINTETSIPDKITVNIQISKDAMESLTQNSYGNKYGSCRIQCVITPLIFSQYGTHGSIIYTEKRQKIQQLKTQWFTALNQKQTDNPMRTIQNPAQQTLSIDYPIIVYKGFSPDNRELLLANLSDRELPQKILHLCQMQFICFVGHDYADREAKIGFLALEDRHVKLCWIIFSQPFKKQEDKQFSNEEFEISDKIIQFNVPVLDHIQSIKRAEFVRFNQSNDDRTGGLFIQTEDEIWFNNNFTGEIHHIAGLNKSYDIQNKMVTILMQRGFNQHFYYVISDVTDQDQSIIQVQAKVVNDNWSIPKKKEVYKINEGAIVALELDQENNKDSDSMYTYDRKLVTSNDEVLNKLYVVDDQENLHLIEQEEGNRYTTHEQYKNLGLLKNYSKEITIYRRIPFNSMSITKRCITINSRNYNFFNGSDWRIEQEQLLGQKGIQIDGESASEDDEAENENTHYVVHSVQNLGWSARQLIIVTKYVQKDQIWRSYDKIITKLLPGTRRQDLVGMKGRRDMESINFISDDLYLIKMKSRQLSGAKDYWTVIDKFGQIKPLPEKLKKDVLIWSTRSSGISRQVDTGNMVVFRGGNQKVLSIEASVFAKESQLYLVEFNRRGEVVNQCTFQSKNYEKALLGQIEDLIEEKKGQFMNEKIIPDKYLTEQEKEVQGKITYGEKILVDSNGQMYRIATVINKNFNQQVTVDCKHQIKIMSLDKLHRIRTDKAERVKNDLEQSGFGDNMWTGIFEVKPNSKQKSQNQEKKVRKSFLDINSFNENDDNDFTDYPKEKNEMLLETRGKNVFNSDEQHLVANDEFLEKREEKLRIIVLLCKSENDSHQIQNAGFVICGDYLCWQYFDQKYINIFSLKQQDIREIELESIIDQGKENIGTGLLRTKTYNPTYLKSLRNSSVKSLEILNNSDSRIALSSQHSIDQHMDTVVGQTPRGSMRNNFLTHQNIEMPQIMKEPEEEKKLKKDVRLLRWIRSKTRVVDLSVMMQNELDSKNTRLCDLPNSTQLSVQQIDNEGYKQGYIWLEKFFGAFRKCIPKCGKKSKENTESDKHKIAKKEINQNLLQISVNNQMIVFDLKEERPKEVFFFEGAQQFMDPDSYVNVGAQISHNYEDQSAIKDGHLFNNIIANRNQSSCYQKQERIFMNKSDYKDHLIQTPVCLTMFKSYSEVDLREITRLAKLDSKKKKIDNIDLQTVLSVFEGHTIFSIFQNSATIYEQILLQLEDQDWEPETQYNDTEIQNNVLRRLYRILNMPTPDILESESKSQDPQNIEDTSNIDEFQSNQVVPETQEQTKALSSKDQNPDTDRTTISETEAEDAKEARKKKKEQKNKKIGFHSVLKKSVYDPNQRIRDSLMAIANKCEECNLTSFAENQADVLNLIQNISQTFLEIVQDSFVQTCYTRKIINMPWNNDSTKQMTFRLDTTLLPEKDCEDIIKSKFAKEYFIDPNKLTKTAVEVYMVNIDWLLADKKSFVDFVFILTQDIDQKIFNTELLKNLVEEFWEKNFYSILKNCLLPWSVFFISTLYFYTQVLTNNYAVKMSTMDFVYEISLSVCIVISLLYNVFIELIQFEGVGTWDYFLNAWNLVDIYTLGSSVWIMTAQLSGYEFPSLEYQRIMAAIAIMFMWIKVLDWLRLFEPTSFLYKLIQSTLTEIWSFMIIFICALASFGCAMYMLQLNNKKEGESVMPNVFGHFLFDSLWNQYMLSLGEFGMDGFDDHPQMLLCYLIFIAATFLTQITFLNMLVALMSDTFERVIEQKALFALMTKLNFMSDYTSVIKTNEKKHSKNYLFVVRTKLDAKDDEQAAWSGGFSGFLKKTIESNMSSVKNNLMKDIKRIETQNLETKNRDTVFTKDMRNQFLGLNKKFEKLDEKSEISNKQQIEQTMKQLEHSKFGNTVKKMNKHMEDMYTKITKKKAKSLRQFVKARKGQEGGSAVDSQSQNLSQISDDDASFDHSRSGQNNTSMNTQSRDIERTDSQQTQDFGILGQETGNSMNEILQKFKFITDLVSKKDASQSGQDFQDPQVVKPSPSPFFVQPSPSQMQPFFGIQKKVKSVQSPTQTEANLQTSESLTMKVKEISEKQIELVQDQKQKYDNLASQQDTMSTYLQRQQQQLDSKLIALQSNSKTQMLNFQNSLEQKQDAIRQNVDQIGSKVEQLQTNMDQMNGAVQALQNSQTQFQSSFNLQIGRLNEHLDQRQRDDVDGEAQPIMFHPRSPARPQTAALENREQAQQPQAATQANEAKMLQSIVSLESLHTMLVEKLRIMSETTDK